MPTLCLLLLTSPDYGPNTHQLLTNLSYRFVPRMDSIQLGFIKSSLTLAIPIQCRCDTSSRERKFSLSSMALPSGIQKRSIRTTLRTPIEPCRAVNQKKIGRNKQISGMQEDSGEVQEGMASLPNMSSRWPAKITDETHDVVLDRLRTPCVEPAFPVRIPTCCFIPISHYRRRAMLRWDRSRSPHEHQISMGGATGELWRHQPI
jgi:hypothetical protein